MVRTFLGARHPLPAGVVAALVLLIGSGAAHAQPRSPAASGGQAARLAAPGGDVGSAADPRAGLGLLIGTASYRERIALPPGAVLEVELADVSRADSPARPLGHYSRLAPVGPPFRFVLAYDPAAVDPAGRYAVRASLRAGNRLLWTTTTHHGVELPQSPAPALAVDMTRVPAAEAGAAQPERGGAMARTKNGPGEPGGQKPLLETEWQLLALDGRALTPAEARGRPTLRLSRTGSAPAATGHTGCNRFFGGFRLDGEALEISPTGMTRMACPDPLMGLEQRVVSALRSSARHRIEGGRLILVDADGKVVAEYQPAGS